MKIIKRESKHLSWVAVISLSLNVALLLLFIWMALCINNSLNDQDVRLDNLDIRMSNLEINMDYINNKVAHDYHDFEIKNKKQERMNHDLSNQVKNCSALMNGLFDDLYNSILNTENYNIYIMLN